MHSYGEWRLKYLDVFNIGLFYYIFPIDNTVSILRNGVHSKNYTKIHFPDAASFSWDSVQERRSQKLITLTGRKEVLLHDVVPLFFNPKNPTLDVKKEDWEKLAILVIDKNVITDENVEIAFTKGNASRDDAEILRHLKDLDKLDWEIIYGDYWPHDEKRYGIKWENWKSNRSSEFFIYPKINKTWFRKILVSNKQSLEIIDAHLNKENKFLESSIDENIFME